MKKNLLLAVAFAFTLSGVAYAQENQGVETPNTEQQKSLGFGGFFGGIMGHNNSNCYIPTPPSYNGGYYGNNYPVYGNPSYGGHPGYGGHPNYGGQPNYGGYPGYGGQPGYGHGGNPHHPGGHYGYLPNHNGSNNYGNYVNNNSFNAFINALKHEPFDNNKLDMAIFFATNGRLRADQIGQILDQFSFDNNRLKFAKAAFNNCIDKHNYPVLRTHFDFSSNFQNLMRDVGY